MNQNEVNILITNIALKNEAAFKTLYDMCSAKLYGLLIKIIGDRELAADTLQDVFTKIWLNADKCDVSAGLAWPWICQLSRNTALDKLRQIKRQPISLESLNIQPSLTQSSNTSYSDENSAIHSTNQQYSLDINIQWQQNIDLNNCLSQIKPVTRKAIILSYIHGLSHIELSTKLKLPLGTLKSSIRRAMKELETCLQV